MIRQRVYQIAAEYEDCNDAMAMKILANIGQEKYFQFSGVKGVFAGLWVEKAIFGESPIQSATRNQGKLENGFQACGTTFWRRLLHNSDLMVTYQA